MKHVPTLSLLLGVVFLVSAALAAVIMWLSMFGTSNLMLPQPPSSGIVTSIAEATSLDVLRKSCLSIAQSYDAQNRVILAQAAFVTTVIDRLLLSALIGGIVIGSAFLYIYAATHKHAGVDRA